MTRSRVDVKEEIKAEGGAIQVKPKEAEEVDDNDMAQDNDNEEEEAAGGGARGMSAFELERLENIRRNKEYLRSIGLGDTKSSIGLSSEAVRAKQVRKSAPRAPRPK